MDTQLERDTKGLGFSRLLSIRDVRNVLGLSSSMVIELIRSGHLDCYNVSGMQIERERITEDTRGVRITPESLQNYLNFIKI